MTVRPRTRGSGSKIIFESLFVPARSLATNRTMVNPPPSSSDGGGFFGWFGGATQNNAASTLGKIWKPSETPQKAFSSGEMNSKTEKGSRVRVAFRNNSSRTLVLCWVDNRGVPYHFYRLSPTPPRDRGDNMVTSKDHVEKTVIGDSFVLACFPEGDDYDGQIFENGRKQKSLDAAKIITGYRPEHVAEGKETIHLVTVSSRRRRQFCMPLCPCIPSPLKNLRGSKKVKDDNDDDIETQQEGEYDDDDDDGLEWFVAVEQSGIDSTPFDTTTKPYEKSTMGTWPVRLEKDWCGGNEKLRTKLERDLRYACDRLPEHARTFLRSNTPLWVNKSIRYGPKACPVQGGGLCFHPCADWLKENGLNPEKHCCVELNHAASYEETSVLWGTGGVMIHELSHAYHFKMLPDGYDNADVKQCYDRAMEEGLYDCVRVHGSQGPTARAYACQDHMEYFAELSTAFLGGVEENKNEEYNKWFPFNRKQLKEHDPRAYNMLKQVWKVTTDDD